MSQFISETVTLDSLPAGLRTIAKLPAVDREVSGKIVFRAAGKSVEFADHLCAHYRETRRTGVEIPCDVKLLLPDGSVFDSGCGTIRNVSPSGALVSGLKLGLNCFPVGVFKMTLLLRGKDYEGICIEATPMRMVPEAAGLGVKFDEIFVSV